MKQMKKPNLTVLVREFDCRPWAGSICPEFDRGWEFGMISRGFVVTQTRILRVCSMI
jgi:hypothetical protein